MLNVEYYSQIFFHEVLIPRWSTIAYISNFIGAMDRMTERKRDKRKRGDWEILDSVNVRTRAWPSTCVRFTFINKQQMMAMIIDRSTIHDAFTFQISTIPITSDISWKCCVYTKRIDHMSWLVYPQETDKCERNFPLIPFRRCAICFKHPLPSFIVGRAFLQMFFSFLTHSRKAVKAFTSHQWIGMDRYRWNNAQKARYLNEYSLCRNKNKVRVERRENLDGCVWQITISCPPTP